MKRIIIFIILLSIIMVAQIDSLEYLDYYPLHIGDKWVYEIIQLGPVEGWDTTYQTVYITSTHSKREETPKIVSQDVISIKRDVGILLLAIRNHQPDLDYFTNSIS